MTIADIPQTSPAVQASGPALSRVRAVIDGLDLGCACKGRLAAALDRFAALETQRARRDGLSAARTERERIVLLLQLLAELDEIPLAEPDASIYRELELLFRDIAAAAQRGARAIASATGG